MVAAEGDAIGAVAIAGVGSSIVGSAALARCVANATGLEVAAIVAGDGATDVAEEAISGWFFYGYTDRIRHQAELTMEQSGWVAACIQAKTPGDRLSRLVRRGLAPLEPADSPSP